MTTDDACAICRRSAEEAGRMAGARMGADRRPVCGTCAVIVATEFRGRLDDARRCLHFTAIAVLDAKGCRDHDDPRTNRPISLRLVEWIGRNIENAMRESVYRKECGCRECVAVSDPAEALAMLAVGYEAWATGPGAELAALAAEMAAAQAPVELTPEMREANKAATARGPLSPLAIRAMPAALRPGVPVRERDWQMESRRATLAALQATTAGIPVGVAATTGEMLAWALLGALQDGETVHSVAAIACPLCGEVAAVTFTGDASPHEAADEVRRMSDEACPECRELRGEKGNDDVAAQ